MALTTNLLNSNAQKTNVAPKSEDRLSFSEFYKSGISLKQLKEGEYN